MVHGPLPTRRDGKGAAFAEGFHPVLVTSFEGRGKNTTEATFTTVTHLKMGKCALHVYRRTSASGTGNARSGPFTAKGQVITDIVEIRGTLRRSTFITKTGSDRSQVSLIRCVRANSHTLRAYTHFRSFPIIPRFLDVVSPHRVQGNVRIVPRPGPD